MPKGTKVYRCVQRVKAKSPQANAYAICQAVTGQSYSTGKPLPVKGKGKARPRAKRASKGGKSQ